MHHPTGRVAPARTTIARTTMARLTLALAATTLLTATAAAGPAVAKGGGDDRVIERGSCSAGATWKLKAKPDDSGLEVEFEVDSNRAGQRWTWTIRSDGNPVASGRRTTAGRSGSFSVERRIADTPGSQAITATATRDGQTCRAALQI